MRVLMLGRFQPLHDGHVSVMKWVTEQGHSLLVAIGSAQESHTERNPFTAGERFSMLEKAASSFGMEGVTIVPVVDLNRYHLYVDYLRSLLPPFNAVVTHSPLSVRLFKEAGVEVLEPGLYERELYSGTEIRRRIIARESWQDLVPEATTKVLEAVDGAQRLRDIVGREAGSPAPEK